MAAIVIGVRSWLVWTSAAIVLVMGLGSYLALRSPPPPEQCRETIEQGSQFNGCGTPCPYPGQTIEWIERPRSHWGGDGSNGVFRCICPGVR